MLSFMLYCARRIAADMDQAHRKRVALELTDVFTGGLILFVVLCALCIVREHKLIFEYGLHIVLAVLVWLNTLYVSVRTGFRILYGWRWHAPSRNDILLLLLVLVNSLLFGGLVSIGRDLLSNSALFLYLLLCLSLCLAQGTYAVVRMKGVLARLEPAQKKRLSWELADIFHGVLSLAIMLYAACFVKDQELFLDLHLHIFLAVLVWGNTLHVAGRFGCRRISEKKWRLPERKDLWRIAFLLGASGLFLGVVGGVFPPDHLYCGIPLCIILSIFSLARAVEVARELRPEIEESSYKAKRWSSAFIFFLLMTGWVLVSSVLLLMPSAHVQDLSFVEALFTCASATSITGLSCINVGTSLSWLGQLIVLMDFQVGAIGVMTFTYFIMMMIGNRLSAKESNDLTTAWEQSTQGTIRSLLKIVVGVTLFIEAIGALLLYFLWRGVDGVPQEYLLSYAVFHSVSAFCNAGITLFPNSMASTGVSSCYAAQTVVLLLITAGTLGFGIYREAFVRLRERMHGRKNIRRWSTYSWLVVRVTSVVLLGGTLILALISWLEPSTHGFSFWESIWNTVGRSAGFNLAEDINQYGPVYKLFMCVLMFVGGNPAGTGGGVFAPVVALCVLEVFRVLRGQQDVQIHARRVARATVERAMATVVLSVIWITAMTMLLLLFEEWGHGRETGNHVFDVLFLEVSAFTTTGYSLMDPANLSVASKLLLSLNMLFGRMGMFTFMLLFITPKPPQPFRYPETNLPLN